MQFLEVEHSKTKLRGQELAAGLDSKRHKGTSGVMEML